MNTQEFFDKYNNKPINFDGAYGNQCMDIYRQYVKEVFGYPQSQGVGGAKDVWNTYLQDKFDRITNSPTAVPQKGDVIIWGVGIGTFGHIAIFDKGDVNSFVSFDQNFPVQGYIDSKGNHIGTGVCHFQPHTYQGVLGWLRSKEQAQPVPTPPTTVEMLPKDVIIRDFLNEACGATSDDEVNAYLNSNKNLRQIFNEVFMGNGRFKDKWIKPETSILTLQVASLNQRIRELESQVVVVPPSDNVLKQTILKAREIVHGKGWPWTKINTLKVLLPK